MPEDQRTRRSNVPKKKPGKINSITQIFHLKKISHSFPLRLRRLTAPKSQ